MVRTYSLDFSTAKDKVITINYNIETNNSIADKWWELTVNSMNKTLFELEKIYPHFKSHLEDTPLTLVSTTSNTSYKQIGKLLKKINEVIRSINKFYDRKLPFIANESKITSKLLNYLHEEFEEYGDRVGQIADAKNWTQDMHNNFYQLNELIHMIETAIHSKDSGFSNFSSIVDFTPTGLHLPIQQEDMMFLEDRFAWGGLYCGYNTLGKDYLTIFPENDYEVVDRDEVRTQSRFSTEVWLNFGPDMLENNSNDFYGWYTSLPEKTKNKIPIGDLNKLQLGRFRIGHVVYDSTFLSLDSNLQNWFIPGGYSMLGKTIKDEWNDNIFSSTIEVTAARCLHGKELVGSWKKDN